MPVRNDNFSSAPQHKRNLTVTHIDCDDDGDVNAFMQKTERPAFPPAADFHLSKSTIAALARADELLKAGDLADAVKWAAVAASLRGTQSQPETA